jgi:hypothetical protein
MPPPTFLYLRLSDSNNPYAFYLLPLVVVDH